ncbi:MAG: hypothetical protein EBU90_27995, partial [Proteobacteria bacterium]|nr:hypothetical protein [Pseudomonadota bacterium]
GTWIQPAGVFNLVQTTGVGKCSGTFQVPIDATQVRLAIYFPNATTGALTLYVDDFVLGPQVVQYGAPITDWQTYTATISNFGTVPSQSIRSRRVGDSLEIYGYFQMGTGGASVGTITLGFQGQNSNVTIDSSKLLNNATIGWASVNQSTSTFFGVSPLWDGTNLIKFGVQTSTANSLGNPATTNNFTAGSVITFFVKVPIVGWSSSVSMSNDTDTRVISAQAGCTSAFAYSASTPINFSGIVVDRAGAITPSATAWKFTAPVSGDYRVSVTLLNSVGAVTVYLWKNGTVNVKALTSATTTIIYSGSTTITLNAGEYIDIRGSGAATLAADSSINTISIERLSGPSVIAATETVAARYSNTSGQGTLNSGSTITITGWTRTYDTHGFFNSTTGIATIPVSGKYIIQGQFYLLSSSTTINTEAEIQVQQAGSVTGTSVIGAVFSPVTGTYIVSGQGSNIVQCNAGDTLTVQLYHNTGSTRQLLNNGNFNWISFTRVGN